MLPPPITNIGEYERTTNGSPAAATSGDSKRNCTSADSPAGSDSRSSITTRAINSLVP